VDTTAGPGRRVIPTRSRSWLAVGAVLTAITSGCLMLPAGTADADTVNGYVPPPGDYAPLPEDFPPPPPPPPPPVSVCVGVGRRIHVSGCN